MCGIAGEITFKPAPLSPEWVQRACDIMAHRGPDGSGYHVETAVALGHRRLSIIDLAGGAQPMPYAGNRYWITYNGEIYNYRHLRSQLAAAGCTFATNSDTEVILAAYATWGLDALPILDGIFAFGIWDAETRSLLLARDHLGVKPLLYQHDEVGLRFASELKVLLAHPAVGRQIDPEGLQDYLNLGYVLSPRTILKDIHKLPAAHYLLARDGRVEMRAYWHLEQFAHRPPEDSCYEQACLAQFDRVFGTAVEDQMVSDVPLGAFLSGGLDSSSVAYYANRHAAGRLQTFSVGFRERSYSELDYARLAADHLKTAHEQMVVEPPASLDELADLIWYYDEPLGDTSIIPTYYLSKRTRQQVTVALSGDGGDELLAGYETYLADRFQALYARLPAWLHHRLIQPAVERIPSTYRKVSLDFKLKQFVANAYTGPEQAHFGWRVMFSEDESRLLTGHDDTYSPFETYARHYDAVPDAAPLNRALYVDVKTWLVDDILTKVDRASMAVSLEVRVPFLAFPVVEYAMSLPPPLKLKGLKSKYLLKQIMRDRLPRQIVNRQKRGFNSPISIWMRAALRDGIDDLFTHRASTIIDLSNPLLKQLWHEHRAGRVDHGFKLWALLSLLLWESRVWSAP